MHILRGLALVSLFLCWGWTVRVVAKDECLHEKQRPLYALGIVLMPGMALYYWIWRVSKSPFVDRLDRGGRRRFTV